MTWRNGIQHCDRERAIRTSAGEPDYDKKQGKYLPLQRFDVTQSPQPVLLLEIQLKHTSR